MRYPYLFVLIALCLTVTGCDTDDTPEPEISGWKKFEGIYNVTKLENQEQYQLHISFDTLLSAFGEEKIHIVYKGFDNSFDSLTGVFFNSNNLNRIRDFDIQHGKEDYNGSRWSLSMLADDPDTPELENTLVNDTIPFYFQKSNIAFYFEDGVPFYECECKHLAVKIE